jgi:hypothetical protein
MMSTCPTHNRWTRIDYADGTVSERDCPECPKRKETPTSAEMREAAIFYAGKTFDRHNDPMMRGPDGLL